MRLGQALAIVGFASLIAAKGGRGYGGGDDTEATGTSSSPASTATGAVGSSDASNSTSALTGTVNLSYMTITVVVDGSTIQYTMQSTGKGELGWMALGFGQQMANSPMVIMWPNQDGSITVSQRTAPGEVMPTLDSNPPRIATADAAASDLTGSQPKLTFTIPYEAGSTQDIIWAFGETNPGDSSKSANLEQHVDSGSTRITFSTDPNQVSGGEIDLPLLQYQKLIVAHAILCTVGFLILLPAGAILARYARTFTSGWFKGHWLFQFALAGPIIFTGAILGIVSVKEAAAKHLDDDHKKWGIAIFVLYLAQCSLGAVVHWVKPSSWTVKKKRPIQNYFHAILGLLVIGLSFYQVRTGYKTEWVKTTGRPPIGKAADIVWYIWVVLVPVLYFAGLALLSKQFRQERPAGKQAQPDEYALRNSYADEPRYTDRR
ncbi:hypothetical protein C8Q80DRAFT_1106923 [Daedaleopsis nitida]|nr:hypothetical protein C8Q80DRAFT_1106923 [Daedaleopsis nitida]